MMSPTGPPPVIRTRSSTATSASSTAWRAIAVGSARAAAAGDSESGIRSVLAADTVRYWAKARRACRACRTVGGPGRPKADPGGTAGTRRTPVSG